MSEWIRAICSWVSFLACEVIVREISDEIDREDDTKQIEVGHGGNIVHQNSGVLCFGMGSLPMTQVDLPFLFSFSAATAGHSVWIFPSRQ